MSDTHENGTVQGEIISIDAQSQGSKAPIEHCLRIYPAGGDSFQPEYDGKGGFSATLKGDGPFTLRATLEDQNYVFAFSTTTSSDEMPVVEIPLKPGQTGIQLFAWSPQSGSFGEDFKLDAQFGRDMARGCIALHDQMIASGKTEAEAWQSVQAVLEAGAGEKALRGIACKTCRDRYYTPGTPYYQNYQAYLQCLYQPPCT